MFVFIVSESHNILTLRVFENYNASVFRKNNKFIRRKLMKSLYAKVVLYFYPCADSLAEQIDDLVEKKAFASIRDFSPCEEQCFKILDLTEQKRRILVLKELTEKALKKFSERDLILFDYKYFRKMPKEVYAGVDFAERKYFRRQQTLLKRFALLMDKAGLDDASFERDYLSISFFGEMKRREEKRSIAYAKKNEFAKSKREDSEKEKTKKSKENTVLSA